MRAEPEGPGSILARVRRDFAALRLRATAYHVLQPLTPAGKIAAVALKKQLEAEINGGAFAVDAVSRMAKLNSTDPDSAPEGGLLAEDFSPGTFRKGAERLEEACFTRELGKPVGPVETPLGYSVLLITERTGCTRDDQRYTRLVRSPDGRGRLAPSEAAASNTLAGLLPAVPILLLLLLNFAGIWSDIFLGSDGGWGIVRGANDSLYDGELNSYSDFTVRSWEK